MLIAKFISLTVFFFSFALSSHAQVWTLQNSPVTTELDGICAVSGQVCWACGPLNTIIRTTNGGGIWLVVNNGISGNFYDMHATDINHAWAGSDDGKIWYTSNGGNNWQYSIPNPPTPFIDAIRMFDNITGVSIGDPPVNAVQWRFYFTTNGGINWNICPGAPPIDSETTWSNALFAIDTGHIWWGTNRSKIYMGSMRGPCFGFNVNAQNQYGLAFQDFNTGVALGIVGNPPDTQTFNLRTITGGNNWYSTAFLPASIPYGIASCPSVSSSFYWIAATDDIYRSTDNGISFSSQINLTSASYCISMRNVDTGWAAGANGKIYKYTANDPIGIFREQKTVPDGYHLFQNYPNPFNPETTIGFSLPERSIVIIEIFELSGKKISTLLDSYKDSGSYSISYIPSGLSSGIYIYTLRSGSFFEAKKMVLLK